MNAIRFLSSVVVGSALCAQIVTFPSDHAAIADGQYGQTSFPYSYGVSRIMAVYESWDLGIPNGAQITRIAVRADGQTLSYGEGLNLEVRIGPTEKTAADLLPQYDQNWFSPPQTVFGPGLFQLPDLNNPLNPNPDGGLVWLTLATPHTYDASKNLLVEWRVLANSNGGASWNYRLDRAGYVSPVTAGPIGCMHSGGQVPRLVSRPTRVGATWYCDLSLAPGNQSVLLFLNVGQSLQPQFPLAPIFAGIDPACQGQVSPVQLFSIAGTTSNNGNLTFSVPIPNDRVFNDLRIASQAFCFDFFSPGGLVVSNGDQIEIGIDPAMTVLASQGNPAATQGTPYRNFGLITLFEHN